MFDSDYANSDYLFARDKVERLSKSLEDFWRLEDKGLFLVNPSSNATLFFVSRIFDQYLDACRSLMKILPSALESRDSILNYLTLLSLALRLHSVLPKAPEAWQPTHSLEQVASKIRRMGTVQDKSFCLPLLQAFVGHGSSLFSQDAELPVEPRSLPQGERSEGIDLQQLCPGGRIFPEMRVRQYRRFHD